MIEETRLMYEELCIVLAWRGLPKLSATVSHFFRSQGSWSSDAWTLPHWRSNNRSNLSCNWRQGCLSRFQIADRWRYQHDYLHQFQVKRPEIWYHWCQNESPDSVSAVQSDPPAILEEMRDYLHQLQQWSKWKDLVLKTFGMGMMIVLKEENLPPLRWRLGCIVGMYLEPNGVTRVVSIRSTDIPDQDLHSVYIRPSATSTKQGVRLQQQ